MLPLTGTFQCSLDEKNQLTLPRTIRDQLAGSDTVMISPGPDKCLWLTNQSHLERLGERLEQSQANETDVRVFKRLYFAQTEKLPVNGDGRVALPDRLAQFAGLHQELVLVGIDDHFEVWDAALASVHAAEKRHPDAFHLDERIGVRPRRCWPLAAGIIPRLAATRSGALRCASRLNGIISDGERLRRLNDWDNPTDQRRRRMTREHKIGVAVTCTFLCLTGAVIGLKMQDPPTPKPSSGTEADAPASPTKPPPQPAHGLITNRDVADRNLSEPPSSAQKPEKKVKKPEEDLQFDPNAVVISGASAAAGKSTPTGDKPPAKDKSASPPPLIQPDVAGATKTADQKAPAGEKENASKIKPYTPFSDSSSNTSTGTQQTGADIRPTGAVAPPLAVGEDKSLPGPVRLTSDSASSSTKPTPKKEKPPSTDPDLSVMPGNASSSGTPSPKATPPAAPPLGGGNGPSFMPFQNSSNTPSGSSPPSSPEPSLTSKTGAPPLAQPAKATPGDTAQPSAPKMDWPPTTNKSEDNKPPPAPKLDSAPGVTKTDDSKVAPIAPAPPPPAPAVKPSGDNSYFVPDSHSSSNPTGGTAPAALPYPPLPESASPGSARGTASAPAPRPAPQVTVYDEQDYVCQPGDTFEKISARFYQSEAFAQALRRHNRHHARASQQMANSGTLTPGEKVFIPPADILEQRYGDAVVKPASPTATQTVPASFVPPASPNP